MQRRQLHKGHYYFPAHLQELHFGSIGAPCAAVQLLVFHPEPLDFRHHGGHLGARGAMIAAATAAARPSRRRHAPQAVQLLPQPLVLELHGNFQLRIRASLHVGVLRVQIMLPCLDAAVHLRLHSHLAAQLVHPQSADFCFQLGVLIAQADRNLRATFDKPWS